MLLGQRAPGERWTSRDTSLAVALTQLEASLCTGCGHPQWLSFDTSGDVEWHTPDSPLRCHPCTARDMAAQAWMNAAEKGEDGSPKVDAPSALRWPVNPHHPNTPDGGDG